MTKRCGVCGETVESNVLACPKCGRGILESEKRHSDSADSVGNTSRTEKSHTGERKEHVSFWKKVFGRGQTEKQGTMPYSDQTPADPPRDALEQQIRVYIEAARYLATCGRFNEQKFDEVEAILSKAPKGSMDSARRAETKAHIRHLLPQDGLGAWDQVKIMEHQSLSSAVGVFGKLLWDLRPDNRSREFITWAQDQIRKIVSLITKSSQ